MHRKFKSGYFHNNNIKYNKFKNLKTKMINMEKDEFKNIYNVSKEKEMANRDNSYKLTNDDYYYNDYSDDDDEYE
jgi:predicted glutamine amidotransferase